MMKLPNPLFPKIFFSLYGLGALGMAGADLFFPEKVALGSAWGIAPGWLREIAGLDLFLALMCLFALRDVGKSKWPQKVAFGCAVGSLSISLNNFTAYESSGLALHVQGALVHAGALIAALATVVSLKRPIQRG